MRLLVAAFLSLLVSSSAHAQNGNIIELKQGFATVIRFDRNIGTGVIGNPDVADVRVQAGNSLVVIGKQRLGATNLIVLDDVGTQIYTALVIVGPPSGKVTIMGYKNNAQHSFSCPAGRLCQRVKDDFEPTELVVPGAGGTGLGAGGTVTVVTPPTAPAAPGAGPPQ